MPFFLFLFCYQKEKERTAKKEKEKHANVFHTLTIVRVFSNIRQSRISHARYWGYVARSHSYLSDHNETNNQCRRNNNRASVFEGAQHPSSRAFGWAVQLINECSSGREFLCDTFFSTKESINKNVKSNLQHNKCKIYNLHVAIWFFFVYNHGNTISV